MPQNHLSLVCIGLLNPHNKVTNRLNKVFQTVGLLPADLKVVPVPKVLRASALAILCYVAAVTLTGHSCLRIFCMEMVESII